MPLLGYKLICPFVCLGVCVHVCVPTHMVCLTADAVGSFNCSHVTDSIAVQ